MRHLKKIVTLIFILFVGVSTVACKESNTLDLSKYLKSSVSYAVFNNDKDFTTDLKTITGSEPQFAQYDVIKINTDKTWTYGLTLESISFSVHVNSPVTVDIDITITNLENGANVNETTSTYYYYKTISCGEGKTPVTLQINDTFINEDSTISFEVVNSIYKTNDSLKIAITDLKLTGQHIEANY